jgi:hypothetical protein
MMREREREKGICDRQINRDFALNTMVACLIQGHSMNDENDLSIEYLRERERDVRKNEWRPQIFI